MLKRMKWGMAARQWINLMSCYPNERWKLSCFLSNRMKRSS